MITSMKMNKMKNWLGGLVAGVLCLGSPEKISAQDMDVYAPGTGNPVIPGYFADPTVVKFGDTYYVYATTDGNGGGLGPSQVWVSKDFVNWTVLPMNWPTTHWIWAPDVMKKGNLFYLYYCQPCNIYCGVSETPRGPWKNILGEDEAILVPDRLEPMAITLDGQTFVDDDGSVYLYWGTWGIYPGHGCGVGKFNPDMKSFEKIGLIPNTQAKDFFEAPFMIKKDGIYYFTYSAGSCHDETYRVQYAVSKTGPMGPFEFPENNPILETNADGTVHGPGHHSIIEVDGEYYIVYHRHNNPHATRGMHRQIAIDKLVFSADGKIEKVKPTHAGVGLLGENTHPYPNLARGKTVRASSAYSDTFKPEYAVDDNNGTLWRAARSYGNQWLEIDLGRIEKIRRIETQFEYATSYYRYKLEVSRDGEAWQMYADKTRNTLAGSPMTDYGDTEARYVRLTITGQEVQGMIGAVWNIRVYSDSREDPPQQLVHIDAENIEEGQAEWLNADGMLGGSLKTTRGQWVKGEKENRSCLVLPAGTALESTFSLPAGMSGKHPWTAIYTVYGVISQSVAGVVTWGKNGRCPLAKLNERTKKWHQVAYVCDGKNVKVYVDGILAGQNKAAREASPARLKVEAWQEEIALADLRMFNWELEPAEIRYYGEMKPRKAVSPAQAPQGLLVHLRADDYRVGTDLSKVDNRGKLQGYFGSKEATIPVKLKQNRLAFALDGKNGLKSSFRLPKTISGVGNYTIAAWVLNPRMEENECIVDLNSGEGELNKVVLGYGKSVTSGVACHYGNFEDIALPEMPEEGKWHHLVLTYDGYAETVYVDGKQRMKKDLVLRLTPDGTVSVGIRGDGQWGFSGYLDELKIYDYALPAEEVAAQAAEKPVNRILFEWNAAEEDYGMLRNWRNEGQWEGEMAGSAEITDRNGRLALITSGCWLRQGVADRQIPQTIVVDFLAAKKETSLVTLAGEQTLTIGTDAQGLVIDLGEQRRQIAVKENRPGKWYEFIGVNTEEGIICYVNGQQVATLSGWRFPQQVEQVHFGENRNGIARLSVLADRLKEEEIESYFQAFQKNEVKDLALKLEAKVLTPHMIFLSVPMEKRFADGLRFRFENVTPGHMPGSSGWLDVPEYLDFDCDPDHTYRYLLKVKDRSGNVAILERPVQITTHATAFQVVGDDFSVSRDFVREGMGQTIWKALDGEKPEECTVAAEGGKLRIGSKDREILADKASAPFLYVEVEGDFVAQVKVSDVKGLAEKRGCAYNEAGLMVMDMDRERIKEVHLSLFPMYPDKGNMATSLSAHGRRQWGNSTGWQPDPYLQIERRGQWIYLRTSQDGKEWKNMPGMPLRRSDLGNKLKVGLFQATYTGEEGYGEFEDFRLWRK